LAAFGQLSEADLVDRLQKEGVVLLSLLALGGDPNPANEGHPQNRPLEEARH